MVPEKIAKSHLLKLTRMLDDIARATKDLEALRLSYQRIAEEWAASLKDSPDPSTVPGRLQTQRCAEMITTHALLKADIEMALVSGTDGKQVNALQLRLDVLEDERDALDANLRATQRCLLMRRPMLMKDPP